jgi:serine hydrolase
MKRAVILHGTDGTPESNWFPWLKAKLEAEGYQVWVPQLPENHTPNRELWDDRILGSRDMSDTIIVGHSSGAVEVLNLLMNPRCPHIRLGVMVGAWSGLDMPADYQERVGAAGMQEEQFMHLFPPEGFDFELIKSKADRLAFLHGSDDPFCPLEQAKYLASELDASITVVPNGHHLGAKFTELPAVWDVIKPSL